MKKILTIISTREIEEKPEDGAIEFFTTQEPEELARALKSAKGKYVIFSNYAELNDLQPALDYLSDANSDIIKFRLSAAYKASQVKDVKNASGVFGLCALAALDSKSVEYSDEDVFKIVNCVFETTADELLRVCDEFKKVKAKLSKEVYTYVSLMLTDCLVRFYAQSILNIRKKELSAEEFAELDKKIKSDIVLYHALETKFKYAKLSKLREKNFKVSLIVANKLKKFLK